MPTGLRPELPRRRLVARAVLSSQPDARLVALARAGSETAFAEIVRRHRPALLRYGRTLLDDGRGEDAVQQALLNAYRALPRTEEIQDVRAWLWRLTHNAALDLLRRAGPATVPLDATVDGVERPEQVLARRESLRSLVGRLQGLPDRQREALVLRELEGRSHGEIARGLGVSEGAVRQLIHRARGTLRAAASFLVPPGLLERLAGPGTAESAGRLAEAAAGGAGAALAVKGAVTLLATGAAVVGGLQVARRPAPDPPPSPATPQASEAPARGGGAGAAADGATVLIAQRAPEAAAGLRRRAGRPATSAAGSAPRGEGSGPHPPAGGDERPDDAVTADGAGSPTADDDERPVPVAEAPATADDGPPPAAAPEPADSPEPADPAEPAGSDPGPSATSADGPDGAVTADAPDPAESPG